jgi:hypothetical protein
MNIMQDSATVALTVLANVNLFLDEPLPVIDSGVYQS